MASYVVLRVLGVTAIHLVLGQHPARYRCVGEPVGVRLCMPFGVSADVRYRCGHLYVVGQTRRGAARGA